MLYKEKVAVFLGSKYNTHSTLWAKSTVF